MFKHFLSALVGTAAVTVGFAGSASAASFGQFQLGGGTLIPFTEATDVTFSASSSSDFVLDFNPEPITPIGIVNATGIFAGFDTAQIEDATVSNSLVNGLFIDFGQGSIAPGITTLPNSSITDGVDVFNLESATYSLSQSGANVAIDVALFGEFNIGGETYSGAGNLTFQQNNLTVAAAESILSGGGSLTDMTFTGGLFTTTSVPEPGSVLGLLTVGGAVVGGARKKKAAA